MMTFERVISRVELLPGNAVLDPAPPDLDPECRPVDALLAANACGGGWQGAAEPTSVLFGLYTMLAEITVPAYVLRWTDVPVSSSGPFTGRPGVPTSGDILVVVRTADCRVIDEITIGGPR